VPPPPSPYTLTWSSMQYFFQFLNKFSPLLFLFEALFDAHFPSRSLSIVFPSACTFNPFTSPHRDFFHQAVRHGSADHACFLTFFFRLRQNLVFFLQPWLPPRSRPFFFFFTRNRIEAVVWRFSFSCSKSALGKAALLSRSTLQVTIHFHGRVFFFLFLRGIKVSTHREIFCG